MSLRAAEEPVPTPTAAPPPAQARPRLEHVLAVGQQQQRRQPRATGTVCIEGTPPMRPPVPQNVQELMRSIGAQIAPYVYNEGLYAQLYQDYETLLGTGYLSGRFIRHTIVDASQTLGNITASYELRLTSMDTWNVTVHVQESGAVCASPIRFESETIFRNNATYTDILRFWQLNLLNHRQLARDLGLPEGSLEADVRDAMIEKYRHVMLYLANNMTENGSGATMDLIVNAVNGNNRGAAGADQFYQLYQLVEASQARPKPRDLATALWFSNRKRQEIVAGGNHWLASGAQLRGWSAAPFNENIIPLSFMYLDVVKAIAEAFALCILKMSHADGGAAREIARQEYRNEFGGF